MSNTRSFLFPFVCSYKTAYVVEFSHLKIRLFTQHQPLKQGTKVFEMESPYSYADLWDEEELCAKIQTIQHSDVMYVFSENHPIMVLKRYSVDDWRLEELELLNGPFLAMNTEATMIASDEVSGEVTLTASAAVFQATDEGRLIRLRSYDESAVPWSAGLTVTKGNIYRSDNKYYEALNGGTTGTVKPVHSEGVRSDGGVRWQYRHDGSGIAKITAVSDEKHATATVSSRLPDGIKEGTVYWELGLVHSGGKYPRAGAFFRNRFAFLINTGNGPQVCLSYSGDFNNFQDLEFSETTAETAITVPVLSTEYNEGKWLYAGDVLFVGTGAAEFYIDAMSGASALAADNVKISQISHVGSKAVPPVGVGGHVFFADRYGLSLRDLTYNYYNEGYDNLDISLFGKHLFNSRIVAMAYQEVPDKILWCVCGNGVLAALTFSAEQEVAALSRHDVSGMVESLAIIPNLTDCLDEVWLSVKRTINGESVRTEEWLENGVPLTLAQEITREESWSKRDLLEADYFLQNSRYLDAAVLFENEAGVDDLEGLSHLEGETVSVFADGAELGEFVVQDGKISLPRKYASVLVGLAVKSQYICQNVFSQSEVGFDLAEKQRVHHLGLMLYHSGGGRVGQEGKNLAMLLYRAADGVIGTPQPLFSGIKETLFQANTENADKTDVLIENISALPMNILALMLECD